MTQTYLDSTMDFMWQLPSQATTMSKNTNYQKRQESLHFMSQIGDLMEMVGFMIDQNTLILMFARTKNQDQREVEKEMQRMLGSFHLIQQVKVQSAFIGKSFCAYKRKNQLLVVISAQKSAAILESKFRNVRGTRIVRVMKRQKNG